MAQLLNLRERFGHRLRWIRRDRDLTQEEFAELIGISVDFLSLIERGVNAPSFETIDQISERLNMQVTDLKFEPFESFFESPDA